MKKSEIVFTTLLTGGIVLSMMHHGTVYRDRYASREDCLADWNRSPSDCEPAQDASSSSGSGYRRTDYVGPSYENGARPRTAQQQRVSDVQVVKRAGFGHTGARFSGGS